MIEVSPVDYKFKKTMPLGVSKISNLIEELMLINFYGTLQLKFESGKIVHCIKQESIKL